MPPRYGRDGPRRGRTGWGYPHESLKTPLLKEMELLRVLELQAETSDLALEPRVLVAQLAVGRLGARRDPVGVRAHAPAPPVCEMRGVDPLPAEEEADLTGAGAGVGGVEDPELLAVAEAASDGTGCALRLGGRVVRHDGGHSWSP